ncbi:hypothetical protein POM88_008157 [Heracleum sosnowskyi]|uniref:DUF674 family protein n=1 Tax=Heracleum sosnowskyi TaxID=360622 RepID=A0AAD8J7H7_9APIA|nr:hypothetical protein POM88_008157 [Heracleum sosnowskyi]
MTFLSEVEIPLKVVIDKHKERVVFAEANSDFVDILFSFLTMPMGTIVRLLNKHLEYSKPPPIGNFNNLYETVVNFDAKYFVTSENKDWLVTTSNNAGPECQSLKINIDDTNLRKYFICPNSSCTIERDLPSISSYSSVKCRHCGEYLSRLINYRADTSEANEGVFLSQTASFVISDDLHVTPNTMDSTIRILESTGIKEFGVLEEKMLQIGSSEILDLLMYSMSSKTPLTDMVFGKKEFISDIVMPSIQSQISTECVTNFKNMSVKVLVQKSNNRILLAQTAEDFVEFLFCFLGMPMGRIIRFLGDSYLSKGVVDNLYRSLSNLDVGKHLKSDDLKCMLLNPAFDIPSIQTFYTNDEEDVDYYFHSNYDSLSKQNTFYLTYGNGREMTYEEPLKDDEAFVRGPKNFMVSDDLSVTPLSFMSCITYLRSLKVPLSDVEEHEINIGAEEALNLLRACLMSTSVLTIGLKNFMPIDSLQENGRWWRPLRRLFSECFLQQ